MALVDSNYEFVYVDVGKQRRMSDSGIIQWTKLFQLLKEKKLNFPPENENIGNLKFVLIGDERFPLNEHLLKPYAYRDITPLRRIYNYRLSRARNVVEDAFGMLAARFRILQTIINITKPDNIQYIVLACCALHNFLRRKDTSGLNSNISGDDNIEASMAAFTPLRKKNAEKNARAAKATRKSYCDYFNGAGKVDWQDEMIALGRA